MTTSPPTPRLVPDRPSDAELSRVLASLRREYPMDAKVIDGYIAYLQAGIERLAAAPTAERGDWERKARNHLDIIGFHLRRGDHAGIDGHRCTNQIIDVIERLLSDAAAPPAEAPAERGDVDAAIERLDEAACNADCSHQGDEESVIRDEFARLRNQVENAAFMLANQEKYMRKLHERLAAYERAEPIGQVHEDGNGERHLAWTVEDVDDYPAGTWLYTAPRVTGGREAQDAARYTWLRCGGWEVMQDPAMWPEALRFDGAIDAAMALAALQAANGGAPE